MLILSTTECDPILGKRRLNIKSWKRFSDVFSCLPIAAVIDNHIFCVHAGISPDFNNLNEIRNFVRPAHIPPYGNLCASLK
jgi:serine/threonine-protein phosphatase PP1 catalytic subunit